MSARDLGRFRLRTAISGANESATPCLGSPATLKRKPRPRDSAFVHNPYCVAVDATGKIDVAIAGNVDTVTTYNSTPRATPTIITELN